jgi:hypothetical protein
LREHGRRPAARRAGAQGAALDTLIRSTLAAARDRNVEMSERFSATVPD